jgi:hypothetical protein
MANTPNKDPGAGKASDEKPAGQSGQDAPATTADAQVSPGATNTQVQLSRPEVEPYATSTADAVDPATGEKFKADHPSWAGRHGFEVVDATGNTVPAVDPNRVPVEVTSSVSPQAAGDRLLAAAQVKAPNLSREFVEAYGLGDDVLAGIARGEIPPPPHVGPVHSSDLYLTPGGWVSAPPGVPLEAAGGNAIAR